MSGRREESVFLGAAGLVVAIAALPPLVVLALDLAGSPAISVHLLGASRAGALLAHSLGLALAVTSLSLVVGVPLGVLVGRFDLVGRRALWAVHAFPMVVPPFLLALGWFHVFRREGALGGELPARALFSGAGAALVLALALCPIVTSLVALAARGVDPSLEDAARMAAGPWRVATRVLAPSCAPAIGLGAIVVFALGVSELGVPMFLRVDVYAAAVFARLGGVDYAPGEAAALSLPLIFVAIALFALERRVSRARSFATLGLRASERALLPLRRWRTPASLLAWAVAVAGAAPIAILGVRALGSVRAAGPWLGAAPASSLLAAASAATAILAAGVVLGHGLVRGRRTAKTADAVAALAFVMPASVLGVGLIRAWNRPSSQLVYATIAIVVVGFVARYAVLGVRACAVALGQSPPEMEHAAQMFGAGYARRLTRVVLPLHARSLAFVWLLVFVFCLRDLETAILCYPPGAEPLTVRIFTLEANGPEGVVAALAVVQVALAALTVSVGALALRRREAA